MSQTEEQTTDDDRAPLVTGASQAREDEAAESELFANGRSNADHQERLPQRRRGEHGLDLTQLDDGRRTEWIEESNSFVQPEQCRMKCNGQQRGRRQRGRERRPAEE